MGADRCVRRFWRTLAQRNRMQQVLAACVCGVVLALPLACILHCHWLRSFTPPIIAASSIDGVPIYICHTPDTPHAPPPLDPSLLQRLAESATRESRYEPDPLLVALLRPGERQRLHDQTRRTPPTPPPRFISC